MVGGGLTLIAFAIALARGLGPAPAISGPKGREDGIRSEPPPRVSAETRARLPPPPPVPHAQRPLDPAALQARAQIPRSADLRNPFELPGAPAIAPAPPRDLKDPFAKRRHGPPQAALQMSPDLRNPFVRPSPMPAARRTERPPPPPSACTTASGVPVQRPRAMRPSVPACPAPRPAAAPAQSSATKRTSVCGTAFSTGC